MCSNLRDIISATFTKIITDKFNNYVNKPNYLH